MDRKSLTIGVLTITATILLVANLIPLPAPAVASQVLKDRDYSVVTARLPSGGDGLYILDNRTGKIAIFNWDNAQRRIRPQGVVAASDAFER
ncbi:MAG: hypothetical protein NZ561_00020 [Phycisphaerae bacterium]|nr:hypothetical protein [Phycisphaerae bacterium]MDW8263414.1 hypothetical protein [Phycisphaerales bacterium]